MTVVKRLTALVASAAVLVGASLVTAPAAHAAAGVTISNAQGAATADPDYATEVTVSGSGFQSVPKGFGGVYVVFGWADDPSGGSWRPSRGGTTGADYRYVPDSETQDNKGYIRFVAFPGSETEGAAHTVLAPDGSWSVSMVIPGAVFESRDRDGKTSSVDCREVTCGIITFGAHGVKNANNETFTPVDFVAPGGAPAAGAPAAVEQPAAAAAVGDVRVGLTSGSVRAGTSVVFTGQGFTPGEQVVAALDGGVTAVGPLTAGARGDVAGALPVPRESRVGTHVVTLTAGASGSVAQAEVLVEADGVAAAPVSDQQVPQWAVLVLIAAIVLALVLVVASIVTSISRGRARRKAARASQVLPPPVVDPPSAAGGSTITAPDPTPLTTASPLASPGLRHDEVPGASPTEALSMPGVQR